MKKNFRITSRHGINFPVALLMCCVSATQASAFQSEGEAVESDKPAPTEQAAPEVEESASDRAETDDTAAKPVKEQLEELTAEFQLEMFDWREKYKAAKTRAALTKLTRDNPQHSYSAKLLELYEANPDDKDAQDAVRIALENKGPRTITKASKALSEIAAEQDLEDARKSYIALTKFGNPTSQRKAVKKLLEFAEEETDDAVAFEMLKAITGPQMRYKTRTAAELIWDRVKAKPEDADFELLSIVGQKAGSSSKAEAFDVMLEHHSDNEQFASVLAVVPETPNEAYEAAVKKVAKNGEGDLQLQAAVSLAQYRKIRARYLDFERMPEEQLERLETESKDLKELLKTFDGDSPLHKQAQSELFELEHLVPGAEALDIVGTDLNGSELKLSDYRGKIVFLDFWGDW